MINDRRAVFSSFQFGIWFSVRMSFPRSENVSDNKEIANECLSSGRERREHCTTHRNVTLGDGKATGERPSARARARHSPGRPRPRLETNKGRAMRRSARTRMTHTHTLGEFENVLQHQKERTVTLNRAFHIHILRGKIAKQNRRANESRRILNKRNKSPCGIRILFTK